MTTQREVAGRAGQYFVILSSKTYVSEGRMTRCWSYCLFISYIEVVHTVCFLVFKLSSSL